MTTFIEEFVKRAQMALDPNMAMGAAPAGMAPPMGGMPPTGMPPVDPAMMGGMPPMDPAMMGGAPSAAGPSPEDIMGMMAALQGGASGEPAAAPEAGAEGEAMVPASLVEKAMGVADSALELAQARGEEDLDTLSTNAAGPMVASGAIDNLSPEEIMALKDMPMA